MNLSNEGLPVHDASGGTLGAQQGGQDRFGGGVRGTLEIISEGLSPNAQALTLGLDLSKGKRAMAFGDFLQVPSMSLGNHRTIEADRVSLGINQDLLVTVGVKLSLDFQLHL